MNGRRLILAALVVALAQIGFLTWMILGRAAILRDGREVLLKVEPVDPRDLFRGDYVRLGYDISRVPMAIVTNPPPGEDWLAGERVIYVRLARGDDGYWHASSASFDAPAAAAEQEDVDIRGTVEAGQTLTADGMLRVTYGIERFYVPEGEGRVIEQDMGQGRYGLKVSIAADGSPQVKALMDGDNMLYEEPLY